MTDTAPLEVRHAPSQDRFEAWVGSSPVGELSYRLRDGVMVIHHTGVDPAHQGAGVAAALVREGLSHARSHGLRVRPLCSYVAAYLRRHPEERDLEA